MQVSGALICLALQSAVGQALVVTRTQVVHTDGVLKASAPLPSLTTGEALRSMADRRFKKADADGSGCLSAEEMARRWAAQEGSAAQVLDGLIVELDADRDEEVCQEEFRAFFRALSAPAVLGNAASESLAAMSGERLYSDGADVRFAAPFADSPSSMLPDPQEMLIRRWKQKQLTPLEKRLLQDVGDELVKKWLRDPSVNVSPVRARQLERNLQLFIWDRIEEGYFFHPPPASDAQRRFVWRLYAVSAAVPGVVLLACVGVALWSQAPQEPLLGSAGAAEPRCPLEVGGGALNGLRFFASAWVVCSHATSVAHYFTDYLEMCDGFKRDATLPCDSDMPLFWRRFLGTPEVAVNFFFVLSGFTLATTTRQIPLSAPTCADFLRRRAKVFPVFWVALGVMTLLQWPTWGLTERFQAPPPVGEYVKDQLFVASLLTGPWISWKVTSQEPLPDFTRGTAEEADYGNMMRRVQHLWFISSIAVSWLLFPVMHNALCAVPRRRRALLLPLVTLGALWLSLAPSAWLHSTYGELARLVLSVAIYQNVLATACQFLVGVCAGWLLIEHSGGAEAPLPLGAPRAVLQAVLLDSCFVGVILAIGYGKTTDSAFWFAGMTPLWAGLLYFLCHPASGRGLVYRLVGAKPLAVMGEYSLYIYMVHPMVLHLLWGFSRGFPSPLWPSFSLAELPACFCGVVLVAVLAFELWEKRGARLWALAAHFAAPEADDPRDKRENRE